MGNRGDRRNRENRGNWEIGRIGLSQTALKLLFNGFPIGKNSNTGLCKESINLSTKKFTKGTQQLFDNLKIRYLVFIVLIGLFSVSSASGQGCSDAGACSISSLNFSGDSVSKNSRVHFSVEQSFGLGEKFILISQTTASIEYRIFKSTLFELRTPFIFTYGNLGQTSGVGDLILSLNQRLFRKDKEQLRLLVAGRLKSNNADFSFNGEPLPMAYQTSLGTYDAIFGLLYIIPKWDFYAAYQHSFGRNKNGYLVTDTTLPDSKKYFESAQLKRGDDVYLRVRRELAFKNRSSLILTLMTIYRLQKDEIIKNNEPVLLDGSQGLTLNLGFTWSKKMKSGQTMDLVLAFPVIDKAYRADGLTRNVVVSIRFSNL